MWEWLTNRFLTQFQPHLLPLPAPEPESDSYSDSEDEIDLPTTVYNYTWAPGVPHPNPLFKTVSVIRLYDMPPIMMNLPKDTSETSIRDMLFNVFGQCFTMEEVQKWEIIPGDITKNVEGGDKLSAAALAEGANNPGAVAVNPGAVAVNPEAVADNPETGEFIPDTDVEMD